MKYNVLRLSILGCGSMYLVDCNSVVEVPPASSSKQCFQNDSNRLSNYTASHPTRSAVLREFMSVVLM